MKQNEIVTDGTKLYRIVAIIFTVIYLEEVAEGTPMYSFDDLNRFRKIEYVGRIGSKFNE